MIEGEATPFLTPLTLFIYNFFFEKKKRKERGGGIGVIFSGSHLTLT